MKFCDYCDNMLYIHVDNQSDLKYTCKNCNFITTVEKNDTESLQLLENGLVVKDNTDTCIVSLDYTDEMKNYYQFLNKDIKYDKTLPRVSNIKCPDTSCKAKTNTIYVKYDNQNMKYLYFCCNCEKFWK